MYIGFVIISVSATCKLGTAVCVSPEWLVSRGDHAGDFPPRSSAFTGTGKVKLNEYLPSDGGSSLVAKQTSKQLASGCVCLSTINDSVFTLKVCVVSSELFC